MTRCSICQHGPATADGDLLGCWLLSVGERLPPSAALSDVDLLRDAERILKFDAKVASRL